MYYRRKILLALLETFDGEIGKIDLQKLLLFYTRYQSKPAFDFVPHRFGCYSFQARWDMRALNTYGYIKETEKSWTLLKTEGYAQLLTRPDQHHMTHLLRQYGQYTTNELIQETYIAHPYYAIRSEIAPRVLNQVQLSDIQSYVPKKENTALYTIGYEGVSIETYFNKLIRQDVRVLCDVRRNAISQKVGFSKHELRQVCEALNITYVHIPELGIESQKRQNLNSQNDYNDLFKEYSSKYLPEKKEVVYELFNLLLTHKRIALTCFEASHCQCHRGQIANSLVQIPEWDFELIHL